MLEVGIQTAPWFKESDPDASFKFISECGYTAVDYNIDCNLPGSQMKNGDFSGLLSKSIDELYEYYKPLKAASEKHGVKIVQMHAPFPLYYYGKDEINASIVAVMEKVCAVAAFLNCRYIVTHSFKNAFELGKQKENEINLNLFRSLMPYAKKYGVVLCLEDLFESFNGKLYQGPCSEVGEANWFVDTLNAEAGEKVFGFCLDIGHAVICGRNLYEFIVGLGDRLSILHIHDNDGSIDLHMTPYSYLTPTGKKLVVDWNGFLRGLRDIGYRGPLCFENFKATGAVPAELVPHLLTYTAEIGKYFAAQIVKEAN